LNVHDNASLLLQFSLCMFTSRMCWTFSYVLLLLNFKSPNGYTLM